MILYSYLLDILKYTVAGIGIIYVAFYMFKPYLDKTTALQTLEFKKAIATKPCPYVYRLTSVWCYLLIG
jgi:hypothetical protein